jgi:hypothetical protein
MRLPGQLLRLLLQQHRLAAAGPVVLLGLAAASHGDTQQG